MQSDTGSNRTISTSLRKLAPAAAKISSNTRGKRKNVGPRSSLNPRAAIADVRRPPHQVAQSPSLAARPRPAESQLPSPQDQCIVRAIASSDRRVRIETAPPLPPGWCGKQHACDVLSRLASHPVLIFLDADVRLKSGAIARMTAFLEQSGSALASGVPEQVTHTFSERLLVPLIHFALLGFLPIRRMRIDPRPALGAGCGQVFVALRHAYVASGGHRAIRDSLHDGLKLPRVFRSAGFRTDLFDATDIASCRMFSTGAEVWRGLARNAGEGLGSPGLIGVASLLLAGGQILPLVSLAAACLNGSKFKLALSLAGTGAVFLPRLLGVLRFRQPVDGALLHPIAICALFAIQWFAFLRSMARRPAIWKGRECFRASTT